MTGKQGNPLTMVPRKRRVPFINYHSKPGRGTGTACPSLLQIVREGLLGDPP